MTGVSGGSSLAVRGMFNRTSTPEQSGRIGSRTHFKRRQPQ
jgi:hypothetical protein